MLKKIIPITTITSLCLLIVLLNTINPSVAGPFGILAMFILAYLSSFGLVTFFILIFNRLLIVLFRIVKSRKPFVNLGFRKTYYFAAFIAAAPIMLIGLQSVGATGVYELLLVMGFVCVGCFFVSKKIN
ncbi:MAG: hypothetical protein WCP11_01060 [Candidatus Saccharibacteria bacterium]